MKDKTIPLAYAADPKAYVEFHAMNIAVSHGAVQIDETMAPVYRVLSSGTLEPLLIVIPTDKAMFNGLVEEVYSLGTQINSMLKDTREYFSIDSYVSVNGADETFSITHEYGTIFGKQSSVVGEGSVLDVLICLHKILRTVTKDFIVKAEG